MSKNLSSLSSRKGLEDNLFERIVEQAQPVGSAISEELKAIADEYLISDSVTLGTASFYDFLKDENRNKKVHICNGTACLVAGTQEALHEQLRGRFKEEEIGEICCLGRCHENGAFQYAGKNYSAKDRSAIESILAGSGDGTRDSYSVASKLDPPLLLAEFPGVDAYYSLLKKIISRDRDELLSEMKVSKLRGRGGAGFPAGLKWESCKKAAGEPKFIVCNADEGDPGAYIDRYLMEEWPHSVLFGMIVAGYLVGSNAGVLYIRAEYPESVVTIRKAIEELERRGLIGEDILGSGFSFKFKVVKGAGSYICGEETALLASLEGLRPEVRVRPPYPTEKGLFGKPTVVNNVETFACVHSVYSLGGEAFSKIGTERSTGPKLLSLDGNFNRPGLYEVAMGTPLSEVVYGLGGGFRVPVKAIQVGGPLGGMVPTRKIEDLTVDFESFQSKGFLLGHAGVVSIPETFPMIHYIEHLFEFTAAESCGKCFPCRLGSVRGMELARKARTENYRIDAELMDDLVETLKETSLCALGGGIPLPIQNALTYFKDELEPYFTLKG